jgi:hypothetical protein
MNAYTPEAVTAEIAYRLERAQAGALAAQVRKGQRKHPSWPRRLWSRPARSPARRATPAMP